MLKHFISTQRLEDAQVMLLVCHARPYHHTFTTLFSRWVEVFCAPTRCVLFSSNFVLCSNTSVSVVSSPPIKLFWLRADWKSHSKFTPVLVQQAPCDYAVLISKTVSQRWWFFFFFFHSGCSCLWIIPSPKPAATINLPASLTHLRKKNANTSSKLLFIRRQVWTTKQAWRMKRFPVDVIVRGYK